MDDFQKYFVENSPWIDLKAPDEICTEIIFKKIQQRRTIVYIFFKSGIAASVILVVGILYLLTTDTENKPQSPNKEYVNSKNHKSSTLNTMSDGYPSIVYTGKRKEKSIDSSINKESLSKVISKKRLQPIKKTEQVFVTELFPDHVFLVNKYLKEISSSKIYISNINYFNFFKQEWLNLISEENKLTQKIQEQGPDSYTIDFLLTIYQQKIQLLLNLRLEINKVNRLSVRDSISELKSFYLKTL